METLELADTDRSISRLAMGGCPLGGHGWGNVDDAESIAAVRRALDFGVNIFDTADVYGFGHSEEILSVALGAKRREVVIATKFGVRWENGRTWKDASPEYLRSALEASLRRLRIDCVPLYYIHWPDDKTRIADTMVELVRCRQQGKIRCIGLSNLSAAQVREAISVAPVEAMQVHGGQDYLRRIYGLDVDSVVRRLRRLWDEGLHIRKGEHDDGITADRAMPIAKSA